MNITDGFKRRCNGTKTLTVDMVISTTYETETITLYFAEYDQNRDRTGRKLRMCMTVQEAQDMAARIERMAAEVIAHRGQR